MSYLVNHQSVAVVVVSCKIPILKLEIIINLYILLCFARNYCTRTSGKYNLRIFSFKPFDFVISSSNGTNKDHLVFKGIIFNYLFNHESVAARKCQILKLEELIMNLYI